MPASVLGLLVVAAVLYFAKEVLLPLALAILLAFLLAPLVERLERWKLGRVAATLIIALLALGVVVSIGTVAGTQAVSLAAKLPEYRHSIAQKIRALRVPKQNSDLGKAAKALKDIEKEAHPEKPLPVKETPGSALEEVAQIAAPLGKPLAMALAVIVFTILMLLDRENMRERLIALAGSRRLNVTTRAMAEASARVSRYLAMLMVVNACFGIPFGIALYFIGVPNALLFGLLGLLLRFVPYVGVWVAAALPIALAFAIGEGWSMALWTIGVFLALELVLAYVVEPWLYGKSVGLTPIAIIAAVLFWTWLWGPAGLLLATPLTVCVAVVGRHIPELGYLNVLLGVEPVLSDEERFYQRLLALDDEEAAELMEKTVAAQGLAAALDKVFVPSLALAARDRGRNLLEPARERFIYDHAEAIVEDLDAPPASGHGPAVCLVPAHDRADGVAAAALARLMPEDSAHVFSPPAMVAEVSETAARRGCKAVCISAVPPQAAAHAAALTRRLRRHDADLRIVVGLWGVEAPASAKERLAKLGADAVVMHLSEAAEALRQLASAGRAKEVKAVR
ncbi:MAG TPA: AI-2E family transporter [Burkholderiales bacterium]|nr:AI-2E family transporter [Burkholderiales bacterium]